jgi:ribosomal protein L29
VQSLKKSLQEVHLELSLNKRKNLHEGKAIRTDIARLKTIIQAKKLLKTTDSHETKPDVQSPRRSVKKAPVKGV